jgi:site-specific recombinase XerD
MTMANTHLIGPLVRRFLLEEVGSDRNLSVNTQRSYRDALRLLFHFLAEHYTLEPTQVTVEHLTADVVKSFLTYLEQERGNAIDTRNLRLTALHSLFRFISRHIPELIEQATQIQQIPLRRTTQPTVAYLEKDEIDAMLATPDRRAFQGQRAYALLLFLYNTGARVTEAVQTNVGALHLDTSPASVRFLGKGRKVRLCPLWPHTVDVLRHLLGARLEGPEDLPVFLNVRRQRMTRFGVHTLVERTVAKAARTTPTLGRKQVSPHTIRHTTAVHLLRAGVDINTIRAWLGHVSLETTNRYAQVDLTMKAKALETCAPSHDEHSLDHTAAWHQDRDLMVFLASL